MSSKDAAKFADSFLTISTFLFTQLEFSKSAVLASRIVGKLCRVKSSKKQTAFKNAAYMYLADGKTEKVERLITQTKKCRIRRKNIDGIRFELLKDYQQQKKWRLYESHYEKLSKSTSNWPRLIMPSRILTKVHSDLGNRADSSKYSRNEDRYYQYSDKNKLEIPVEALDAKADEMLIGLNSIKKQILDIELKYPANVFQNAVKKKFSLLDRLVTQSSKIQDIGSGNGIVKAYKVLIETHYEFSEQVKAFEPEGMKKEFVPLFKKDMTSQIVNPLLSQAQNYEKDANRTISKNEILSINNSSIQTSKGEVAIRFWYNQVGVLMDRGGQ